MYLSSANQYMHCAVDLDQALSNAGIVLDGDVYVKFTYYGDYASTTDAMVLDDVRVSDLDVFGPQVTAQSPPQARLLPRFRRSK